MTHIHQKATARLLSEISVPPIQSASTRATGPRTNPRHPKPSREELLECELVRSKPTAFGRVTQRASSDPVCFSLPVKAWEDSRITGDKPGIRHQRRNLCREP